MLGAILFFFALSEIYNLICVQCFNKKSDSVFSVSNENNEGKEPKKCIWLVRLGKIFLISVCYLTFFSIYVWAHLNTVSSHAHTMCTL